MKRPTLPTALLALLLMTGAGNSLAKPEPSLRPEVFAALQQARTQADEKRYRAALTQLQTLPQGDLSPYEQSQIWNLRGYLHYHNGDAKGAIRAYQRLLNVPALDAGLRRSSHLRLAQLHFQQSDYPATLRNLDQYLADGQTTPKTELLLLKGQAHYQIKQYPQAANAIGRAIRQRHKQGKKPTENTLLLLQAIYYEQEQYKKMLPIAQQLLRHYPKPEYLRRLGGIYSQLGRTREQLSVTEALYQQGALKDAAQLLNLAKLYLLHKTPYKAGQLLEAAFQAKHIPATDRNLRLLARAWLAARETDRALSTLTRLADSSGSSSVYLEIGHLCSEQQDWSCATQALQKAVRGGRATRQKAQLLLGVSLFKQGELQAAKKALLQAKSHGRSKKQAEQWLSFIEQFTEAS